MEFKAFLQHYRDTVEAGILEWLPEPGTPSQRLHDAMHYAMKPAGKRIRPVIVLAISEMYPSVANALPAAVAIEMLHTYTLIHDDLPGMDDSPLRRGRPTLHVAFDEATAILAGDALLTEAFRVLATAYAKAPEVGLLLTRILAEAAGSRELISGQMEDTRAENQEIDPELLRFIHSKKTAALISAAFSMGLATTSAPQEARAAFQHIGHDIGEAYQVVDDILDATGSEDETGKPVGGDAQRKKNTYVRAHGLESSRAHVRQLTNRACARVRNLHVDASFIESLALELASRSS